jgi:beta-phosphoglucomutase-like phosphatase (HAD superfamily)
MVSKPTFLWDMDVVLVDTGELHYQSWLEMLTDLSIYLIVGQTGSDGKRQEA